MGRVRDWANQNSTIITVAAVLLLIASLGLIVVNIRPTPPAPSPKLYFYDLGSTSPNPLDRLFVAEPSELPPIVPPSGKNQENSAPGGVRAYVFACGDCSDRSSMFIGYLEAYTPERKAELLKIASLPQSAIPKTSTKADKGHLLKSPDGQGWLVYDSHEASAIRKSVESKCPQESLPTTPCDPPRQP